MLSVGSFQLWIMVVFGCCCDWWLSQRPFHAFDSIKFHQSRYKLLVFIKMRNLHRLIISRQKMRRMKNFVSAIYSRYSCHCWSENIRLWMNGCHKSHVLQWFVANDVAAKRAWLNVMSCTGDISYRHLSFINSYRCKSGREREEKERSANEISAKNWSAKSIYAKPCKHVGNSERLRQMRDSHYWLECRLAADYRSYRSLRHFCIIVNSDNRRKSIRFDWVVSAHWKSFALLDYVCQNKKNTAKYVQHREFMVAPLEYLVSMSTTARMCHPVLPAPDRIWANKHQAHYIR